MSFKRNIGKNKKDKNILGRLKNFYQQKDPISQIPAENQPEFAVNNSGNQLPTRCEGGMPVLQNPQYSFGTYKSDNENFYCKDELIGNNLDEKVSETGYGYNLDDMMSNKYSCYLDKTQYEKTIYDDNYEFYENCLNNNQLDQLP